MQVKSVVMVPPARSDRGCLLKDDEGHVAARQAGGDGESRRTRANDERFGLLFHPSGAVV
jgi:hypothetical protein